MVESTPIKACTLKKCSLIELAANKAKATDFLCLSCKDVARVPLTCKDCGEIYCTVCAQQPV